MITFGFFTDEKLGPNNIMKLVFAKINGALRRCI